MTGRFSKQKKQKKKEIPSHEGSCLGKRGLTGDEGCQFLKQLLAGFPFAALSVFRPVLHSPSESILVCVHLSEYFCSLHKLQVYPEFFIWT